MVMKRRSGPGKLSAMQKPGVSRRRRLTVIAVVAGLHLAAIFGLLRAFDIDVVPPALRTITAFSIDPESPAPPPPSPAPEPEPEGAAAPPAPKATPAPKAAPKPRVARPETTPLPPTAAQGASSNSGASEAGSGTGGGGSGAGTGSGGSGSGAGSSLARKPIKIAGDIGARDYPRASVTDRDGAFVIVHFTVGPDGVPRGCRIAQSSGNAEVDRITCTLVQDRFRYEPALDANGSRIPALTGWKQWWWR